jgi:uncharacterized protein YggT (Ycf19 family)
MEPAAAASLTRSLVLAHWYYFVPQYLLAVLMWTMAGRFLLGLFVPQDWGNYIWRFFRRLTDPVLAAVRPITPSFMIEPLLPLVALWWLLVLRVGFEVLMGRLGLRPSLVAAASG